MNKQSVILESLKDVRQSVINEAIDYKKAEQDMKSNSAYKRLNQICNKYGYNFDTAFISYDGTFYQLKIRLTSKGSDYHRDIYLSDIALSKDLKSLNKEVKFIAQTTSYGALDKEEYNEFKKAVEDTNNLLFALDAFDFTKLALVDMRDK